MNKSNKKQQTLKYISNICNSFKPGHKPNNSTQPTSINNQTEGNNHTRQLLECQHK